MWLLPTAPRLPAITRVNGPALLVQSEFPISFLVWGTVSLCLQRHKLPGFDIRAGKDHGALTFPLGAP